MLSKPEKRQLVKEADAWLSSLENTEWTSLICLHVYEAFVHYGVRLLLFGCDLDCLREDFDV